jgi:hypothetical protein
VYASQITNFHRYLSSLDVDAVIDCSLSGYSFANVLIASSSSEVRHHVSRASKTKRPSLVLAERDSVAQAKGDLKRVVGAQPARDRALYATISHTLPLDLAERLRAFAHYERVSASSVMEFALVSLFRTRDDTALGAKLRRKGAGPRRKSAVR